MFFRLNNLTQFISGKNMALYNLKNNIVYIIDNNLGDFLTHCEKNNPIEEHPLYLNNKNYLDNSLSKLINLELGYTTEKKTHVEKFKFNTSEKLLALTQPPPFFYRAILSYSSECNLKCDFCKKTLKKNWQGCESCFQCDYTQNKISDTEVLNIIDKIKTLNIKELLLKGGNPLLNIELLEQIIDKFSNQENFKLKIISNGLGIDYDCLSKLLSNDFVELKIVMFGIEEFINNYSFTEYHENIIRQQSELIDKLFSDNFNFNITFQITDKNEKYSIQTINHLTQKYKKLISVSNIITDNNSEKLAPIKNGLKYIPTLDSPKHFFWNMEHNRCTYGTFSIDTNRQLMVCSESKDNLGDIGINGENFYQVLSNTELYETWNKCKDNVSNCKDCALRYFCLDCFEFEKSKSTDVFCNILTKDFQIDYSKIANTEFIKLL